jgi:hypothetical protein
MARRPELKVRQWAIFDSDLPTDQIEIGPEIVQLAGRSVADALAEVLRALGCYVRPPVHADGHGWDLEIEYKNHNFWGEVALIDRYGFVLEECRTPLAKLLDKHRPEYFELLLALAEALRTDPRFREVGWYDDHEAHEGTWRGADTPLSPRPT